MDRPDSPSAARRRIRAWLWTGAIGLAIGFAGARAVRADAPPLPGEVVPRQIPYRGYLEQGGVPVSGMKQVQFDLYTAATGGASQWTETQMVTVSGGRFEVDLGDTTGIPIALLRSPALYLSVTLGGQTLVGRQRLLSGPYARRAGDGVPPGAVMFFNLTACPSGWHELTAAAGRAVVGVGSGNAAGLAQVVGPALADREVRQHTHGVSGGTGLAALGLDCGWFGAGGLLNNSNGCLGIDINCCGQIRGQEHTHSFSTTSQPTADIVPYIQLLTCQKD
jgi:hypothetical protein